MTSSKFIQLPFKSQKHEVTDRGKSNSIIGNSSLNSLVHFVVNSNKDFEYKIGYEYLSVRERAYLIVDFCII